jgi:hypothetical protein
VFSSLAVIGTNIYGGTPGGVCVSGNDGMTWELVNNGLPPDCRIWSLLANGSDLFAGSNHGAYRTTDGAAVWTSLNNTLPDTDVYALAIQGTNLFAGTGGMGVFLSTNNGINWTPVNNGVSNALVASFANIGPYMFLGTGYNYPVGIFRTSNNGGIWEQVSGTNGWAFSVVGNNLFVGTEQGVVLLTRNYGPTWDTVDYGWPLEIAHSFVQKDGDLYAGTASNGVFRRPLSEMLSGVEEQQKELLSRFSLNPNFPNPFNPSTTITYSLPHASNVTLTIFNPLGQQIATLLNERQNPGVHSTTWNAEGHASGVYYYQLRAGEYMVTRKLILVR